MHGRKGPVVIDIPKDVSSANLREKFRESLDSEEDDEVYAPLEDFAMIASAWKKAERPVILAGHGVLLSDAQDLLYACQPYRYTVTTTLLGKGAIPETHSLYSRHARYAWNGICQ